MQLDGVEQQIELLFISGKVLMNYKLDGSGC